MPQDRNFEGGGRPSHKSLGRRARDLGLVIVMAPNIIATGLPVVAGVQEAFMQPNAIVWVSSTNFGETTLLKDGQQPQGCPPQQQIFSAEQIRTQWQEYEMGTPLLSPNDIVMAPGSIPSGLGHVDGVYISTDGGGNYTFICGASAFHYVDPHNIEPMGQAVTWDDGAKLWSPHTTNGKHDLFIGVIHENDGDKIALFSSSDGKDWEIAAEKTVPQDLTNQTTIIINNIIWADDGKTVQMNVIQGYDVSTNKASEIGSMTLSLNGETNYQATVSPSILDQIANNDTLKIIASVAGALILIYFFARISVGAQDDDWFS